VLSFSLVFFHAQIINICGKNIHYHILFYVLALTENKALSITVRALVNTAVNLINSLHGAETFLRANSQEIPRLLLNPFTGVLHCPLFWAKWFQSINSHPISPRSILILSFHLCLWSSKWSLPSRFPTAIFMCFSSPLCALHSQPTSSSLELHVMQVSRIKHEFWCGV